MMSILPDVFASTPSLLAIFGAMALVISGAILIASSVRIGGEAVARRVDMVKPRLSSCLKPRRHRLRSVRPARAGKGSRNGKSWR